MYKDVIVWTLLSVYTIVDGTVTVCVQYRKPEIVGSLDDYTALVKVLKQELTQLLVGDGSSQFYDHSDFDFHHPALSAKGEINNVTVSNLDDYELKFFNDVNITENKIKVFNLTFHNILAAGEYKLRGNIGDLFDIFGEGHFWFLNLMNDDELEELFNNAIVALASEIVDVLWLEFKDAVDGPLQQWIDSVIKGHSQYILGKIMRSQEDLKEMDVNA
ncbi:hypothetical protein NQ314_006941 [Rhamnusium bicolor]|uniref:Uncharacterized protein n=1 Tax=Rhamnusium bicolor TaxID=1586634 RepID=A0AAV8YU75_9CUCU|nr:hypothetical protein NQ314_006941 [Rhamnusium bicolor]